MSEFNTTTSQDLSFGEKILRAITEVNRDFCGARPDAAAFERLLEVLLAVTNSEYGFIGHIVQPESGPRYLKTRALTNIAWTDQLRAWFAENAPAGLEFRNLDTLFGEVIRSGDALIANDAPNHPKAKGTPLGHPPLRQFMGIPLKVGREFVGMAGIANRAAGYDEALLVALEPLTGTIAQMLFAYELQQKRANLEEELRIREERWRYALTGSGEGVFDWDMIGETIYLSQQWKAMLGYDEELLDSAVTTWSARVHPDDLERTREVLSAYLSGTTPAYENEYRMRHGDGSWRWILAKGKVVAWTPDGRPSRFVGTQTDISERKAEQSILVEEREAALSSVKAKSEFLAVMTHELRTPLK